LVEVAPSPPKMRTRGPKILPWVPLTITTVAMGRTAGLPKLGPWGPEGHAA
jgi:hypothetical protein